MTNAPGTLSLEEALDDWMATEPIHVLYVEDNLEYADWLQSALQTSSPPIEMEVTDDPETVEEYLARQRVDCVLSDHMLPKMSGVELLVDSRDSHEDLPFIILTGYGSEQIASEAIKHGVTDYLPKKLVTDMPSVLAERILNAVSHHRRTQYTTQFHRTQWVTSEINRLLVTADSIVEIDNAVCEVISGADPYVFAWIGEHTAEQETIVPRAYAGVEAGFLDEITSPTHEASGVDGPTGHAVHLGEISVMQDILNDPRYEPRREQALEGKYQSSAAIPLAHDDTLYGVLHVYADRSHAFSDPEIQLLEWLSETIAAAMHRLTIQEALTRANLAIEHAGDAIFITDREGAIEYVNPAFESLTGYAAAEVMNRPSTFLKSAEMNSETDESMWDSICSGDVWEGEVTNKRQSGEPYVAEQTVAPIMDDDGNIDGFITVQRDITDRLNRQQVNETQRNRLRVLFDEVPDGIVVHDESGEICDVNQTLVQMLGYSRAELLSMQVSAFEIGVEPHELRKKWASMEPGAMDKVAVEGRHRRSDGSSYPVEVWVSRVEIESENVDQYIALTRDISERKEREQRLELFERVIEEAGHAIVITDLAGEIEYVNPMFEKMTGYTESDAVGQTPRILKSGKHDDEFYGDLWETILSGDIWRTELINRAADGSLFHVDQTIAPVTDEAGQITHFVGIESDVSDHRLNEQRLNVLMRILRHNLRNSMNLVLGHATHLLEEQDETTSTEPIEIIHSEANRVVELSEKALLAERFFHTSARDSGLHVDVAKCINTAVEEIEATYPTASITIRGKLDGTVCGDERVRYAFQEAMENAVEHSDKKCPHIEISIRTAEITENGLIELVIADDGPGIPKEQRDVIRSGEETPLIHGSGIGLWLIEWAVASVGGEVTFEDNAPRGTRVVFHIPSECH